MLMLLFVMKLVMYYVVVYVMGYVDDFAMFCWGGVVHVGVRLQGGRWARSHLAVILRSIDAAHLLKDELCEHEGPLFSKKTRLAKSFHCLALQAQMVQPNPLETSAHGDLRMLSGGQ